MPADSVDELLAALRNQGLRATTPRRIIVETLLAQPDHVTADGLTDLVQAQAPLVNKATIYRTLEALESLGVVDRMAVDHGPAQWHLVEHGHHQHLVCTVCGSITESSSKEFGRLARALAADHGFQVDMHIAISGRCRACADKRPSVSKATTP
jgi:Fur family ferric uptake transcriptional regulator